MSHLFNYITNINANNKTVLSIFLTYCFPDRENFLKIAMDAFNNGADILEIGIPFSDPIADGEIIQLSSKIALQNDFNMDNLFSDIKLIKSSISKPIILMGYINPIIQYSKEKFISEFVNSGADGIIIPDLPIEELSIFSENERNLLNIILLATPNTDTNRLKEIDNLSSGFVYCVSINGTTGKSNVISENVINNIERTYKSVNKNKLLTGFGISSPQDIQKIKNYCDGVIVGSAFLKKIINNEDYAQYLRKLSEACS